MSPTKEISRRAKLEQSGRKSQISSPRPYQPGPLLWLPFCCIESRLLQLLQSQVHLESLARVLCNQAAVLSEVVAPAEHLGRLYADPERQAVPPVMSGGRECLYGGIFRCGGLLEAAGTSSFPDGLEHMAGLRVSISSAP